MTEPADMEENKVRDKPETGDNVSTICNCGDKMQIFILTDFLKVRDD